MKKILVAAAVLLSQFAVWSVRGETITYSFFGGHGRQNNPAHTAILADGTYLSIFSGGRGHSDFPEINEYISNNPSAFGWFTVDTSVPPYFTNATTAFYNSTRLSLLLPPVEDDAGGATNGVATFVYNTGLLQESGSFTPPARFVAFGDNSANAAQPFPTQLRLPGSRPVVVLDLADNFSTPLPISGPALLHVEGPEFFDLELVDVTAAGSTRLLDDTSHFPATIDLRRAIPSASRITVQFTGLSTNFWLDPEDYSPEDFAIMDAYVKSNVTKLALSEFLYYDLSFLESDQTGRETVPTFANYYSGSYVRTTREFLPPPGFQEQRRGGVGLPAASAGLWSTHGGSASARSDVYSAKGLSVGVKASASSSSGTAFARTVAFNTFRYIGTQATQLMVRASLTGEYIPPSFGLPSGLFGLKAGIAVFDREQFNTLLRNQPTDYLLNTTFDGLLNGPLSPALKGYQHASFQTGNITENLTVGPADSSGHRDLTANLASSGFAVTPAVEFITLLHLEANSQIGCLGGRCGASTIYLYDSLELEVIPFTTPEGQPVANVIPAPQPTLEIISIVPSPSQLTINWAAVVGRVYQVQSVNDPVSTNWVNFGNPITATNNEAVATISVPLPAERSFFRILGVQ